MVSSRVFPPMAATITTTRTENPNSLSAQLAREPTFVFAVPDVESADSLEAITKEVKGHNTITKIKYKSNNNNNNNNNSSNIGKSERKRESRGAKKTSIPMLTPIFVSNGGDNYPRNNDKKTDKGHHKDGDHKAINHKGNRKTRDDEKYIPYRQFDNKNNIKPQHGSRQRNHNNRGNNNNTNNDHTNKTILLTRPRFLHRYTSPEKKSTKRQQEHERKQENHEPGMQNRGLSPSPRNSSKYSSRLTKPSPGYFEKKPPTSDSNNGGRINKYALTLSRHRRIFQAEDEGQQKEQQPPSKRFGSFHARLHTDSAPDPRYNSSHARLPTAKTTAVIEEREVQKDRDPDRRSPSGSSRRRNRFERFLAVSHDAEDDAIDPPSGAESHRDSPRFGSTTAHNSLQSSKNSKASLASSLDASAPPDGIIAFGAVLDHLTKGGSILNANKVYRNEVQLRDQCRAVDPMEAYFNKVEYQSQHQSPKGALPQVDSYDVFSDDNRYFTKDRIKVVSNAVSEFGSDGELSISTLECDKYATIAKHAEDRDDNATRDGSGRDPEKEERDWCVPGLTDLTQDEESNTESLSIEFEGLSNVSDDYDTNFDSVFDDTTFETSSSGNSYDSDSLTGIFSGIEGETTTHRSSSIISSCRSLTGRNLNHCGHGRRPSKTKGSKKKKKKRLMDILQGKKRPEEIQERSTAAAIQVLQVDRLPDSFQHDNDENINRCNNPHQHEGNLADTTTKNPVITNKDKGKREINESEDDIAGKIRALKVMYIGCEDTGPQSGPPAPKHLSKDPPGHISAEETTDKSSTEAIPKQRQSQGVPVNKDSKATTIEVSSATTTSSHAQKLPSEAALLDRVEDANKNVKEVASIATDHHEDTSLCGLSLAMGSILSYESWIDSPKFFSNMMESAAQITNDSMRSARSIFFSDYDNDVREMTAAEEFEHHVKSIERTNGISSIPPPPPPPPPTTTTSTSTAPGAIWVPEYADCDEGLEDTKEKQRSTTTTTTTTPQPTHGEIGVPEYADCDEGLDDDKEERSTAITRGGVIATSLSTKKRKPFRKRIPFLQLRKGGPTTAGPTEDDPLAESKNDDGEEDRLGGDDVSEAPSLQVDIHCYDRENTLVNYYIDPVNIIDPKSLFDVCDGGDMYMASCDLAMATENINYAEQIQSPSEQVKLDDVLSMGLYCCGNVPTDEKMISILTHQRKLERLSLQAPASDPNPNENRGDPKDKISKIGCIVSSSSISTSDCTWSRNVDNPLKQEGRIVSSSENVDDKSSKRGHSSSSSSSSIIVDHRFKSKPGGQTVLSSEKSNVSNCNSTCLHDEKECLRDAPSGESPIERVLSDHNGDRIGHRRRTCSCEVNNNNNDSHVNSHSHNSNNNSLRSLGRRSIFNRKKKQIRKPKSTFAEV